MIEKVSKWLWGDMSQKETRKYGLLALAFLFIIGTYWLLRPMKDAIFASTVGIKFQPTAKIVSLCFLLPVTLLYSKLVDMLEKHRLFYVITLAFAAAFTCVTLLLAHPTIGLANTVEDPSRILGWTTYVLIEAFGSLMVAMFWSFVASSSDPASAKKGFPFIIFAAQFGSIAGPTLATQAEVFGLPMLMAIGVCCMLVVICLIAMVVRLDPAEMIADGAGKSNKESKKPTGMLEGLRLLFTKPYVAGIFGIATLYEVVGTIMDFQMKVLARDAYATPESFTQFMAYFGQCANGLSLLFALVGTSFFMRRFGLSFCLLLFPFSVAVVVTGIYMSPGLWQMFAGMVAIKGLSYALNNPSKEIMYIPTSKDVRYKAKSWIDVFGSRGSKAVGSGINNSLQGSAQALMTYGTLASLGVIAIWIAVAAYVGRTFAKLTSTGQVIEDDNVADAGAQPALAKQS